MASLPCFSRLLVVVVVMAVGSLALPSAPFDHPEPRVNFDTSCRCGQKNTLIRIVGGHETEVNEWPWMAAILYGDYHFCGASLINDRYVLTAAHCTQIFNASEITVRLAEHDLSTDKETTIVTRSVSQIIDHPEYDPDSKPHDISLLKLSSPVEMSSTVLPVCMPPLDLTYVGETATTTGWGQTAFGGPSPNILQEVDVKVVENDECKKNNTLVDKVTSSMLCAAAPGKDSCHGDSGGPLVFKDAGDNYDLIGVVSWGHGCARPNYPGVYTRVSSYLKWIKDNTQDGVYCADMKL